MSFSSQALEAAKKKELERISIKSLSQDQKHADTVNDSLNHLFKKQQEIMNDMLFQVEELLNSVSSIKQTIQDKVENNEQHEHTKDISKLHQTFQSKNLSKKINKHHKEFHSELSKFGKLLEKKFHPNISAAYDKSLNFPREQINDILTKHFFREGKFFLGDTFIKEANVFINEPLKEPFEEMHRILDFLNKRHDVKPAIEWAKKRHFELEGLGSSLEFKLHRLHFIHLLTNNKQNDALQYAREVFQNFSDQHMDEIEKLMTCLIFSQNLSQSPYSSFTLPAIWKDVSHDFTSACCVLLGLSYESPLYIVTTAGTIALPKQLKVSSLTQGKAFKVQPVEILLGKEFSFHTIFACPVSREQTTPDNPPMLLTCGHVISNSSVNKLLRGNSRFKCPSCPREQRLKDLIKLTL